MLLLRELDLDARARGAAGAGEAAGLDLQGDALLDAGEHLARRAARAGPGEKRRLRGRRSRRMPVRSVSPRAWSVPPERAMPATTTSATRGSRSMMSTTPVVEIAHRGARHQHLARGAHGLAVEAHVRRGQLAEDVGDAIRGEPARLPPADDAIDREVLVRGGEGAAGERARGRARQRDAEQLLGAVGAHHHAPQRQGALLALEAVAHAGDGPLQRRSRCRRRPRLGRGGRRRLGALGEGDHRGGDVGAGVDDGVAVAGPLAVVGVEGDRRGDRLPARPHPRGDGVAPALVAEDRALAGELDALGPGPGQAGLRTAARREASGAVTKGRLSP